MVKVYVTNITPLMNSDVYRYYYDRVGKYRQEKADRLKSAEDRARSVGAGAVLRFAVEDSTDLNYDLLDFKTTESGKPYIENDPIFISLSHSGDYAVCAVSDSPIGVDIEQEREFSQKIKERFAKSVLEWTKKEAKGKLTGGGFFDNTEDDFVYTHEFFDGYIITVCSKQKADAFLTYHLPYPC